MSKEKYYEIKLRKKVGDKGGLALKFSSNYFTGVPDRIVLMPGGKIFFAEIKDDGLKPTPRQDVVIELLRKMGFDVSVINSNDSLFDFLQKIEK
jgi:hypothetical protein